MNIKDIGIDMDGVLYEFVGALRNHIHVTTGRPLDTMPNPTAWEFYETDWGISEEQFMNYAREGVRAGTILRSGDALPGAVAGMKALHAKGHRLHIVTDREKLGPNGLAKESTVEWLKSQGIPYTTLTLTHDKASVPVELFVDDRPHFYEMLTNAGVDTYLMNYPYNAALSCPPDRRVNNFTEFVNAVI